MLGLTSKHKDCRPVFTEYKDTKDAAPRLGFNTKTELSSNISETPEGYIICRDVALARTGTQIYGAWEVPLIPGPDGTIVVERPEEEVFRPETIESFRGKPFTNDHPSVDVSPSNFHQYMVGTVMNPRRGTGDRSHCLLGDIIVYDSAVIKQIRDGKREVSCGYDSTYVKLQDGYGRQTQILGNHVSLVDAGRCGATCAILDQKATPMAYGKNKFLDALRKAFKAKDDAEFQEILEEAKKEGVDESEEPDRPDTETKEGSPNNHTVTVNIGGMSPESRDAMRRDSAPAHDEEPEGEAPMDPNEMIQAAVTAALGPLMERVGAIEASLSGMAEEMDGVRDPDDTVTTDAIARAEILKPGFKLPTFDAKPGSVKQREAVVGFQRQVLSEAFATADGRAAIAPLLSTARPNFQNMAAGEVGVVFRAASERMRDAANARIVTALPTRIVDGERKTFDNKAWNDKNKQFWKRA